MRQSIRRLQGGLCLSFDILIRAETKETLFDLFKNEPFYSIVGKIALRKTKGKVDYVYFPSGSVVAVAPDIMDRWCWMHLRIMGEEANKDYINRPTNTESDRWNKSKLRKWFEINGTRKKIRGTEVYECVLKDNKRVQVWREKDMIGNGSSFHSFDDK